MNFIKNILQTKENEYLNKVLFKQIPPKDFNNKNNEINNIINNFNYELNIKNNNNIIIENTKFIYLKKQDYNKLHELSITKGGFLTMKNRQEIYKKILCYDYNYSNYFYDTIWINKKNNKLYNKKEFIYKYSYYNKDRKTIKIDVERCNLNKIFPPENYYNINLKLKKYYEKSLNTIISFNNFELKYYQGYHDIFLIFFILYIQNPYIYTSLFQKFSELYLKENLSVLENSNNFSFNNHLKLFNYILNKISPSTYDSILKYSNGEPTFIIGYILSLFTHYIDDIFIQMRLFDYFLMSHPLCIYILTALITIDEIINLKKKYYSNVAMIKIKNLFKNKENEENENDELNVTDFYLHFQKIDFNKIDFENYIEKTEEEFKKINFEELNLNFINEQFKFEKYYCLMNKENYIWKMIKNENTKLFLLKNNIEYNLISNYKFINKLNQNILYYKYLITKKFYKNKGMKILKKIFPFFFITNSIITIPLLYNFYKR